MQRRDSRARDSERSGGLAPKNTCDNIVVVAKPRPVFRIVYPLAGACYSRAFCADHALSVDVGIGEDGRARCDMRRLLVLTSLKGHRVSSEHDEKLLSDVPLGLCKLLT
jgi:hypothetical protein